MSRGAGSRPPAPSCGRATPARRRASSCGSRPATRRRRAVPRPGARGPSRSRRRGCGRPAGRAVVNVAATDRAEGLRPASAAPAAGALLPAPRMGRAGRGSGRLGGRFRALAAAAAAALGEREPADPGQRAELERGVGRGAWGQDVAQPVHAHNGISSPRRVPCRGCDGARLGGGRRWSRRASRSRRARAPRSPSRRPSTFARSRPARPAGSRRPGSSTSTATGGWRSSRRSTRPSSTTRAAGSSARARRPAGASTRRASSPTSTATAGGRSWSAATTGPWRRTSLAGGRLRVEPGWPASTCSGGQCPEARGMAAADLDGDGASRSWSTTTNTSPTGSQVFVFDGSGAPTGPPARGRATTAVRPRRRRRLQRDRQPRLRRLRRERGHRPARRRPAARGRRHVRQPPDQRLQPRRHVGARVAVVPQPPERPRRRAPRLGPVHPLARARGSSATTTTATRRRGPTCAETRGCSGPRRRRRSPTSTGTAATRSSACPTWSATSPTRRRRYAFMALDGAQRGGARSARRHRGFRTPPLSRKPAVRPDGELYPPSGIPAPTVVNIRGTAGPEIVASIPDGAVYAVGPTGRKLWRFDYARGTPKTFASEVVAADLNRDGRVELVFGVYGAAPNSGRLVVLSASGKRLHDIRLRRPGHERQRDRRAGGAVDRRPRRRPAPGDRAHDVRPRDRRLPRPALAPEPPAVADRARRAAARGVNALDYVAALLGAGVRAPLTLATAASRLPTSAPQRERRHRERRAVRRDGPDRLPDHGVARRPAGHRRGDAAACSIWSIAA